MDTDLFFVIGLLLGGLSIPVIISAFSEGRRSRMAAVLIVASGALIAFAILQRPGGYAIEEIPDAFYRVLGRYLF